MMETYKVKVSKSKPHGMSVVNSIKKARCTLSKLTKHASYIGMTMNSTDSTSSCYTEVRSPIPWRVTIHSCRS